LLPFVVAYTVVDVLCALPGSVHSVQVYQALQGHTCLSSGTGVLTS
jgi:hypothetical protein